MLGNGTGSSWYFTKESGRVPRRCGYADCASCEDTGLCVLPGRAYLAVVAGSRCDGAEVCIAKLSQASVDSLLHCLLGKRMRGEEGTASRVGGELVRLLVKGGWNARRDCKCSVGGGLCTACARGGAGRKRGVWIARNGFTGVFPSAEHPWFSGVTDAVDIRGARQVTGWRWLSCGRL